MASHKRTSSAAGNVTEAPGAKRQNDGQDGEGASSSSQPANEEEAKYVYLVKEQAIPAYEDDHEPVLIATYASLEDANSKVYAMREGRKEEGAHWHDYNAWIDKDGCLSWEVSHDGGENDGLIVSVEKARIFPSGSEPVRDWRKAFEDPWSGSEEEND